MSERATFLVDKTDIPALRNAVSHIARIGYCETLVCERLGLSDINDLLWRALPIYRDEKLSARDALALAIDLFLLQGSIPSNELSRLFDAPAQDVLIRTGILSIDGNGIARARTSLYPVGDRLVFSDHAWPRFPHPGLITVPYDQVMYVGTDSRWLARATVRKPVGSTLDLCTGSGVHALLASSHSQRVIAVDINPRAIRCTNFNIQASGITNIEVLAGDLYEPVPKGRFDLITANPPFVPSPVDSLQFRDGGRSGEDVQRRIIAGLPNYLASGGIAQIVTEFGERHDEPLSDRLRGWLQGAPMDILVFRLREVSATSYAIGHANSDDTYDAFFDSVQAWASNLRTQGYSRIVSVLLAFQWSDPKLGKPWTRIEESQPPHNNAGNEVEAMFSAERLAQKPDLYDMIEHRRVLRAGPIGLMDARMLGSELHTSTQAKLLGKAFPIMYRLAPVEREILQLIEKTPAVPELIELSRGLNLDSQTVLAAIRSLLRRGLVLMR